MGRPRRVYPNSLSKYDKFHTRLVKMFSGVHITGLHLIKETAQFFMGFESWCHCCGNFKALKYEFELKFNIPVISNEKTIAFLDKHAWKHWVDEEIASERKKGEMQETIDLLNRLFPEKKKIFFYELNSIISAFCHGSFISYDDKGNVEELREHAIKSQKYYCSKYKMLCKETPELQALYDAYHKAKDSDKKLKDEAFTKFHSASQDYVYEKYNLVDVFINIGENSVVCPCAFSRPTVEGSEYEHAGEIYFVVTPDAVYFETTRHY
jgi:hypothetical protein